MNKLVKIDETSALYSLKVGGVEVKCSPKVEGAVEALQEQATQIEDGLLRHFNAYDKRDIVRRQAAIVAGALKLGAYQVRDLETSEFSKLQFHATYDNIVLGIMSEEAAVLFARFVRDTLPERFKEPAKAE